MRITYQVTKYLLENMRKIKSSTKHKALVQIKLHFSEDYYLDLNFDESELKTKEDNLSNKQNCENIVVIEEEYFSDTNLTHSAIFLPALIKSAKLRINQKSILHTT